MCFFPSSWHEGPAAVDLKKRTIFRTGYAHHANIPDKEQVPVSAIGNLLWFFSFGLILALQWWLTGLLMFCLIIGIPWAKACFVIG